MKRSLLVVFSIILILASAFGFYAGYVGLKDVDNIKRSQELLASNIEDAVDLIDENLDDYNEMIKLEKELKDAEEEEAKAAEKDEKNGSKNTGAPSGTSASSPARSDFGKPSRNCAPADQIEYDNAKAAYDSAEQKVASSESNLKAAQDNLAANQAKADSLSESVQNANAAYSEYQTAQSNYNSIPDELASSKQSAKAAMDSSQAKYNASLGGYSSIGEMETDLANTKQNVNAGKTEVAQAEQTLAADRQALNTAKNNLDAASSRLSSSQPSQSAAPSVDKPNQTKPNSTISQLISTKKATDEKEKEEKEEAKKETEKLAKKLNALKKSSDAKTIVEVGIDILLDNEDIASRVIDESSPEDVLKAARDYLDDTEESISSELALRQQLYSVLRILGIIGAVAGLFGIIVSIFPNRFLFVFSLLLTILAFIAAAGLNVYGYMSGYLNFVYTRLNGTGGGELQLYSMLTIAAVAFLSIIVIFVCLASFKKALKKRKLKKSLITQTELAAKRRAERAEGLSR